MEITAAVPSQQVTSMFLKVILKYREVLTMISCACCSGTKGKGWSSKMKFSQKKQKEAKAGLGI